jgi:hypothetical protein
MQRLIKVDGKVRTDPNYPAGFMGLYLREFCRCSPVNCVFEEYDSPLIK